MTSLNTENRKYITWQYQQLNFGLLGGLRIEGLERMRITLKVEYKQQAVRHNLDLYNTDSLDKLIRRCAERFALGSSYMASAFATLINLLETYRLDQLKLLAIEKEPVKQLTEAERRDAEQFLRQPDLLQRTNELIGQWGDRVRKQPVIDVPGIYQQEAGRTILMPISRMGIASAKRW